MISTTTKSYNEDKIEKLGITLPVKLLQKIDNIRGDVPRRLEAAVALIKSSIS
jgi:hypothetical protein